jgi:hypothetical protein
MRLLLNLLLLRVIVRHLHGILGVKRWLIRVRSVHQLSLHLAQQLLGLSPVSVAFLPLLALVGHLRLRVPHHGRVMTTIVSDLTLPYCLAHFMDGFLGLLGFLGHSLHALFLRIVAGQGRVSWALG